MKRHVSESLNRLSFYLRAVGKLKGIPRVQIAYDTAWAEDFECYSEELDCAGTEAFQRLMFAFHEYVAPIDGLTGTLVGSFEGTSARELLFMRETGERELRTLLLEDGIPAQYGDALCQ